MRGISKGVQPRTMVVAGVMSGTSADGVDVALCRISAGADGAPKIKLLAHRGFPYPKTMRAAVLRAMDAQAISVAELTRLSWRLAEFYADCVATTADESGLRDKLALVGCHGQTIYHQAEAQRYLGEPVRCTLQIGEASVIAEQLRVPVVSDFRPADLAAGGQGAPLVPMLDYTLFRHAQKSRVLLNLGGIANLTALPASAGSEAVMAFDTGPANMVIDAVMQRSFGKAFDRGGRIAAKGAVLQPILDSLLQMPYFSAAPPKSCGREQFGAAFVDAFAARCADASPQDIVATATAFTSQSVVDAVRRFVLPHLRTHGVEALPVELIAAGGGARNGVLMESLSNGLKKLGVRLRPAEDLGMPVEAKEAVAFALLAWLRWHELPGNIPSATGALRPALLGKVTLA